MPAGRVTLTVDGAVAVITNANPRKLNAFDDAMDDQFFGILGQLLDTRDVRVVIWRAEGPSFSSGRDTAAMVRLGDATAYDAYLRRRQRKLRQLLDLSVPIVTAMQGWVIGVAFQRALLTDVRIAADDAKFRLPEVGHGVIADAGGVARLHQTCGSAVTADMVLTGRTMTASEALQHGVISRMVPSADLDEVALGIAGEIAAADPAATRGARSVLSELDRPALLATMERELNVQQFLRASRPQT
ncbi:hypothetical protein A5761_01670 [Mycolicibacterium setense]|nr:hypothetical protein A5761_01670 [Mycolicibacterium setense]